jgi:ferric-dicitrate binding protein FerR (iron transport regulator)
MTDNQLPNGAASPAPDVVEQNLERLLEKAYKPEVPDAEFVQRVRDRLAAAARDRAPATLPRRWPNLRRRGGWILAAAASLAGLAILFHFLTPPAQHTPDPTPVVKETPHQEEQAPAVANGPEKLGTPQVEDVPHLAQRPDHLTPRPRPETPQGKPLAVGEIARTASGERRRVPLPDGSILYLNQKTEVKLDADRHVTLSTGEVFVEVAPRSTEQGESVRFLVKTPQREVVALGTKFDVAAIDAGTGITVTQGKVRVSGLDDVLIAGQQLAPGAEQPTAAPRAAAALAWTRELMCAAETPLVPPSKYTGGALVADDPSGQAAQLSLRKYHVDVHIEDGFARTTIDQTYFNHTMMRLQGTFFFPLPADASLSRLAMYVNGQLMEGGMAERNFAAQTFESIVRKMQDPALLEWVDGSTFKMRVFPLEARQEKRIVLSYTQRLSGQYGRTSYRFPAGHSLEAVRDWSFHARVKDGKSLTWSSDTHADLLQATIDKNDLVFDAKQENVKIEGDVALDLFDGGKQLRGDESARFATMDHDNARYFMVRYRPELPTEKDRRHRDWVFLFESSGDRDPLLARAQIDVIRTLLANAEHDDTFAIVTAATRAGSFAKEAKPATPENIAAAVKFLEGTHLVGLFDMSKALAAAEPFLKAAQNPYLVQVGSGLPGLGETKADVLARRIPEGVRYVGVGVGKRWNRALMKAAAERSGGFFTQINPDEPINWRSFELYSALTAPRLLDVKVVDDAEKATFLTCANAISQGEEVCALASLTAGAKLPEAVTVTGTLDGKTFSRTVPVKKVVKNAGALPRTWAKLEIDRLLAENAQANRARILQLSMASYVMTPFTSLLVLENEQMYAQYGVDRGRKDHWAMYPCPNTIPVVYEPQDGAAAPKPVTVVKPSVEQVLATILVHVPPRAFADGAVADVRAVTAHDLYAGGFGVPLSVLLDKLDENQKLAPIDSLQFAGIGQKPAGEVKGAEGADKDPRATGDTKPPATVPVPGPVTSVNGSPAPSLPPPPQAGGFPGGPFGSPSAGSGSGMPGGGWGYNFGGGIAGLGGGLGGGGFAPRTYTGSGPAPGLIAPQEPFAPGQRPNYAPMFLQPSISWETGAARNVSNPYNLSLPYLYNGYLPPDLNGKGGAKTKDRDRISVIKETGQLMSFDDLQVIKRKGWDAPAMQDEKTFRRDLADLERLKKLLAEEEGKEEKKRFKDDRLEAEEELSLLVQRLATERSGRATGPKGGLPAIASGLRPDALLYQPPTFAPDGRLFTDLIAFAPGLNTTSADIHGVLEAEAAGATADTPGIIEPAARALIDGARAAGWRTLSVPAAGRVPAWALAFDGSGRYAVERVLPSGLKEQVICDGKELLHLYAELGLGSRRTVTRFHRAEFADLVPWVLPPAKDLAHGFDLKCAGERIVALTPRGLKADQEAIVVQLVFAEDGRLEERRLVELPKNKVLRRETYATDGTVKLLDADNKTLSERKLALKAGGAPDLDPDLKDLVVLPMPLRTRDHIVQQPGAAGGDVNTMERTAWLALLASDAATGNAAFLGSSIQTRAWNLADNRLGFAALLLSAGYDVNALPAPLANLSRAPLSRYVAWLKQIEQLGEGKDELGGGLLHGLAEVQSVLRVWQNQGALIKDREAARAIRAIRETKSPIFAWAVVAEVLRSPSQRFTTQKDRAKAQRDVLEAACAALKDVPGLSYAARYEFARHLSENGEWTESRKRFAELYEETARAGSLPPLDRSFRAALQASGKEPDLFSKLLRERAASLVKEDRRVAVVALAWQCWELESPALANELLSAALDGITDREHRTAPTLAAVEYLSQTHQFDRADKLLQGLLDDEKLSRYAGLWRLGYQLALQRKQPARAFTCLAQALELEYREMPEWIDVAAVRRDYAALLAHYAEVVRATATLGQKPPADLAAKVVRAADRWRWLDVDGTAASAAAFQSLRGLGQADLAWDYLLMSSGAGREGFAWVNLAQQLQQEEDFDLAERAYEQVCAENPGNPDLLRARADNLMRAGRAAEGREVLKQIGDVPAPLPPAPLPPAPQVSQPEKPREEKRRE